METEAEIIDRLVDNEILEAYNLDPNVWLAVSTALVNLRLLKKLVPDGMPLEEITREWLIEKLTGKAISPDDVESSRLRILARWKKVQHHTQTY